MIQQLSIYTENKRGAMNRITETLAKSGININGFITNDSAEFGTVRMIVSDAQAAQGALQAAGYLTRLAPVVAVEVSDEVGSLNQLLSAINRANISINYMYATFDRDGAAPIIVIQADDMPELESYLLYTGVKVR